MNIRNYLTSLPTNKQSNQMINIIGPLFQGDNNYAQPIVYVDGGAKYRRNSEGFSVGDGDSFSGKLDEYLPIDKDYSDLSYVLKNIPLHFDEINLLGFLGGRKDHELINLAEVHLFLENSLSRRRVNFDQKIIALSAGNWSFLIEGTFTLFAFKKIEIKLDGKCKYPIEKELTPLSSHGLSNVGSGNIHLKNNAPVFIFLNNGST
jgi:thiamine pyrophosphokinase